MRASTVKRSARGRIPHGEFAAAQAEAAIDRHGTQRRARQREARFLLREGEGQLQSALCNLRQQFFALRRAAREFDQAGPDDDDGRQAWREHQRGADFVGDQALVRNAATESATGLGQGQCEPAHFREPGPTALRVRDSDNSSIGGASALAHSSSKM